MAMVILRGIHNKYDLDDFDYQTYPIKTAIYDVNL